MKILAKLNLHGAEGPDPWDESWGPCLPLHHIICREADGTPHDVNEFLWPWSAYTKDKSTCALHFYYWNQKHGPHNHIVSNVSVARKAYIRELQFLMTRQLFYGNENAPKTLQHKLYTLKFVARFAELKKVTIRDVLTKSFLLDACGESIPDYYVKDWISWLTLLRNLNPESQLGFEIAKTKRDTNLGRRATDLRRNARQFAPLPTRIYGELISNLAAEIKEIEANASNLLAALDDALVEHAKLKDIQNSHSICIGPSLIARHGLEEFLGRRGFNLKNRALAALSAVVTEIFLVCKFQVHVFSGMRRDEMRMLPFHCMVRKKGRHGRIHNLIAGVTTKFNKGRRLRTHWVTTESDGFRAIRLAQRFSAVIYKHLGQAPSKIEARKDDFPLFPTTRYFPWNRDGREDEDIIRAAGSRFDISKPSLKARLFPRIDEKDVEELEEIDRFRSWREEPKFAPGQLWPLTTHQLRRSLAMYANASGLVRLTSLRRQLDHITREMSLYYGRGSNFCKNFIANDPENFKKHVAPEWQDGEDEAMMLSFTRDVLNSQEPLFGGAGTFYQRQKERGNVMARYDVERQVKAGLLSYIPGPLGGCTKTGGCDKRKGLSLIDVSCATDDCKNLIGKHSKVIKVIQLKRAAIAYMNNESIEAQIEREELEALERVERRWRHQSKTPMPPAGETHV